MIKTLYHKIKKSKYGYFLFKSLLFLFAVITIDFLVGNTLRHFYFNQISGDRYRTTYDIENTTANIIIFGSSRANHHYHPEIFEKRLNQACRNVGHDGHLLLYNYAVLKGILIRHTPKVAILDIVAQEFMLNQYNYDNLSVLLPYYKEHPELHDIIEIKSRWEKIKLLSQIYPFNSMLLSIFIGNTDLNKKRKPDINGYIPLSEKMNEPIKFNDMAVNYEIDNTKLEVFESFIRECKKSNVKLIIICSPYYYKFNEPIYSIALAKEIASKNNLTLLDYSKDSLFISNPSLFSDHSHLNDEGARIFSNKLIDEIQCIVSNQ